MIEIEKERYKEFGESLAHLLTQGIDEEIKSAREAERAKVRAWAEEGIVKVPDKPSVLLAFIELQQQKPELFEQLMAHVGRTNYNKGMTDLVAFLDEQEGDHEKT